jgi:hypothetical protein
MSDRIVVMHEARVTGEFRRNSETGHGAAIA